MVKRWKCRSQLPKLDTSPVILATSGIIWLLRQTYQFFNISRRMAFARTFILLVCDASQKLCFKRFEKFSMSSQITLPLNCNSCHARKILIFLLDNVFRNGRPGVLLPLRAKRSLVERMSSHLERTWWHRIQWTSWKLHASTAAASLLARQNHWRFQRLRLLRSSWWLRSRHVWATISTNGHPRWRRTRKTLPSDWPYAAATTDGNARRTTRLPTSSWNVHTSFASWTP